MKRMLCLILALLLFLGLAGCSGSQPQEPANFYYRQREISYESDDASVIAPEIRDLTGFRDDLDAVLSAYFAGPSGGNLESPFPRDTAVVEWSLDNHALTLVMSENFAVLSGVELSIACGCISRTFLELTDVRQIVIRAEHSTLDGNNYITMSDGNLLLQDDVIDRLYPVLTLYYMDVRQRYLIGRECSISLADEAEVIAYLIDQMANQPEDSELASPLPADTELLDVSVNDGVCVLNFSPEFETNRFASAEAQRLTLLSLTNTLTQLDSIQFVEFCVEGKLLAHYGRLTITGAYSPDERAIGPVRTALGEFDATVYLTNGSAGYLAPVPIRIRQTTSVTQAELLLRELLSYKNINGFENPIAQGTAVNSVTFRNSVCYVDLSAAFLSSPDRIPSAVRSIVASLCALDSVNAVKITVDGTTPDGEYAAYFGILRPSSDWYL